ncbi:hypothetical protein [Acetobacter ghanensis]|uniref:Uncharacterized protein n=1 Tax=Acetobacter ghanensis TaxID=431306 RepID=A0A0U5F5Y3_9PROT|nr:hypothetical protein [Acetobacter ghanensis]NHO39434.1 hypothetical protein [Acetobacter ghanensis]GBQ46533.1 hypothetical protein AA18895_0793 [Acetobacter ghanensis DSM 18895]CEF54570.1 hypothetical protein predicted by Glimmer/Critica [Acetobacter ghanensis]
MMTREEQTLELAKRLAYPLRYDDGHIREAEDMILEAEHRAEQRVRAEIGLDSERLDWIGTQDVVIGEYGGNPQWEKVLLARYQRTLPADLLDIRVTIDAAREVG